MTDSPPPGYMLMKATMIFDNEIRECPVTPVYVGEPRIVSADRLSHDGLRLLVCGGRDFHDWPKMWAWLDDLDRREGIGLVIDGAQKKEIRDRWGNVIEVRGADYWANGWAIAREKKTLRFPADWSLGRRAGPIRNQRMLDEGRPNAVAHFPGGRGTADMVRRATAAGVRLMPALGA